MEAEDEKMLHLLRNMPPHIDGRPIDLESFRRLTEQWSRESGTLFGSWTRRRPRREAELEGGSVYFVSKGWTMFRMPFVGLERVSDFSRRAAPEWRDAWAITCRPQMRIVESRRIHRLQGWRYLEPANAPPDCD